MPATADVLETARISKRNWSMWEDVDLTSWLTSWRKSNRA